MPKAKNPEKQNLNSKNPNNSKNPKDQIREVIENSFYIINKDALNEPFVLNPVQRRFLSQMTGRDIILKARQQGFSSLILAIFTFDFLFKPNSRQVVVSHEADATQKLLDKVKHYIKPFGLDMKYNSRNEMYNDQIGSTFYIGTAGAAAFGRGDTIHNLHASEVAFYNDADKLMTGLLQSVPIDGRVFLESTANGMGNYFHREWEKAVNGGSNFTPHFFSWKDTPEYQLPVASDFSPGGEERELMVTAGLTKEQIEWRRFKMKEFKSTDLFNQEYPLTADIAFISSGTPVFDMKILQWYKAQSREPSRVGSLVGNRYKMSFEDTPKGNLRIWELPTDMDEYVIGADVAERHDFSCAYVMKKRDMSVVAVWHGQLPADTFGRELERLGYFYNTAFLGVERNNQGIATLVVLNQLYYPMLYYREDVLDTGERTTIRLGWETSVRTRPILIADLGIVIRNRDMFFPDAEGIRELQTFTRDKNGKEQAQSGCFDDRVMALAITIQMYKRSPSLKTSSSSGVVAAKGIVNQYDTPSSAYGEYMDL